MKGVSLITIFAGSRVLDYSAIEWQNIISDAFDGEFYRREINVLMRQDLKTDADWRLHALALSKGKARIYSYTLCRESNSSGQTVDPQLHPYTGCLGTDNKNGAEIPLIIHGMLPASGTLGAHIYVEFKDIYNKMEKDVVFFGNDIDSINYQAAVWCESYFTKCQQCLSPITFITMDEVWWNPYSRETTYLKATSSKTTTNLAENLMQHFARRAAQIPQDGNPCVTFHFERKVSGGEFEKSSFQVRITHVKV